ncbi:unnamed protein product [Somion occarium]|uniref:Sodium/calcium exchanger membrane region domain-containing protein n=1 Tax=Somion occarium TaxID=3059160 RepID=A0ABP1E994_9APHY
MTPDHKLGQPPSFLQGVKAVIFASWLNLLLVCIPISWSLYLALPKTSTHDTITFIFAFLAIIPLAKLLAFATDELSMRVGQTLAGLLNATLGNAVELIVAIIALVQCELQVVQSSLVGSILSNLLLVLGMCFFAGGTRFSEQGFGVSATQLNSSLLIISVIAILLPAAFHFTAGDQIEDPKEGRDILAVSHGAAIILLFIYGCYLVFQLFSHKELYGDEKGDAFKSTRYVKKDKKAKVQPSAAASESAQPLTPKEGGGIVTTRPLDLESNRTLSVHEEAHEEVHEEDEVEKPSMSVTLTVVLLVVVTVLVAVTAEFLVRSIDGLTASGHISKEFVGVILLPIVGNAAEHVTAVTVSVKDKLTLSLGVAVGSSIQIALFVIPFIVTLGWIIGKPLTLLFDPFESIVMFLSVIVVNYVVQDGKSNWLEGMLLMCLYVILAVVFWYYPGIFESLSEVMPFNQLLTCLLLITGVSISEQLAQGCTN